MDDLIIFNALETSLSGGIGRYCYELSKAIYLKHSIPFKIIIRRQDQNLFGFALPDDLIIVDHILTGKQRNLFEQFKLPRLLHRQYKNAILHVPDIMAPIFCKEKVIITVHDLAFRALNDGFTWTNKQWKSRILDIAICKAKKVLSVSEFTKSEIEKYYPQYIEKVSTVYNGFNDFSDSKINLANVRDSIQQIAKSDYFFTLNTISPRKNIGNLIKAFEKIKNITTYNLIVSGKKGWMYENVFQLVEKLGLAGRVIFTNEISDDELKYLYRHANIFVYCSVYEGFGLSPLEAMSYGVPCIVSNAASLPEVVGDAALLVDPFSIDSISHALLELTADSNKRSTLCERGSERVKIFSWDRCADETISNYKSIFNK